MLGEKILGIIDYFLSPPLHTVDNSFNDQKLRQQLFHEITRRINFSGIIETGTFRGDTAKYMNKVSGLPVYTVELNPRYFGYAKARTFLNKNIRVFQGDSRAFLISASKNKIFLNKKILFYLDAHWYSDLPLVEEIQIIFENWKNAVVMIDDFQVPFDDGYTFDNYGQGKALSLPLLRSIEYFGFKTFFPSKKSGLESGYKRGCVVLANDAELIHLLGGVDGLAQYTDI